MFHVWGKWPIFKWWIKSNQTTEMIFWNTCKEIKLSHTWSILQMKGKLFWLWDLVFWIKLTAGTTVLSASVLLRKREREKNNTVLFSARVYRLHWLSFASRTRTVFSPDCDFSGVLICRRRGSSERTSFLLLWSGKKITGSYQRHWTRVHNFSDHVLHS